MQLKTRYLKAVEESNSFKGTCIFMLTLLHQVLERCYAYYIRCFFPVDESVVILRSMPDYADNARALADFMLENGYDNKYNIYFDVKDCNYYQKRNKSISFVTSKAKYGKYKLGSLRLLLTAGYLMSTHGMMVDHNFARKSQHRILLWHGCGYKDKSKADREVSKDFDKVLVPGGLFVKTKAYFWNIDENRILPIGYPRYDWLKRTDLGAMRLIDTFRNNQDTKVILWMPTYRADKTNRYTDSDTITQFPLMNCTEDWIELDKYCIENNIILLVKLHPFQKKYDIPFCRFVNIREIDNRIFEDADVQMYKFIALTDALISDYSSVAVDYLIVNRPIAFTLDDFEAYKKTRGFVFENPLIYMPGHHLYNMDDMKHFLSDVSRGLDPYKDQRTLVSAKAIYPSDNYCQSILNRIGITI